MKLAQILRLMMFQLFIFLPTFVFAAPQTIPAPFYSPNHPDFSGTRSLEFDLWNVDSPARRTQMDVLNNETLQSLNTAEYKAVKADVSQILQASFGSLKTLNQLIGKDFQGLSLYFEQKCLQCAQEIYSIDGVTRTILFSSKDYSTPQTVSVLLPNHLALSPQKNYIVLALHENGAIDQYRILVLDLQTKKVIIDRHIMSLWNQAVIQWQNAYQFVVYINGLEPASAGLIANQNFDGVGLFDVRQPSDMIEKREIVAGSDHYLVKKNTQNKTIEIIEKATRQVVYLGSEFDDILGELGENLVLSYGGTEDEIDPKTIYLYNVATKNKVLVTSELAEKNIISTQVLENKWFVTQTGEKGLNSLHIFDQNGQLMASGLLPEAISLVEVTNLSLSADQTQFGFNLVVASPVAKAVQATMTLQNKITSQNIVFDSNTVNKLTQNQKYIFKIMWTKSSPDSVPYLLVALKTTNLNQPNKAMMNCYPAFNNLSITTMGYLGALLVEKGFIYIQPAVRGSSDLGFAWKHAIKNNYTEAAWDLVRVAEDLMQRNMTKAKDILTYGGSNGGKLVTMAAVLSPKSFGLVISNAGLYDQMAYKGLQYNQWHWQSTYSDPDASYLTRFDHLKDESVIEMIKENQELPPMYVFDGYDDDRTNVLHTFKLASVVNKYVKNKDQVHFRIFPNSGHWFYSPRYQNASALEAYTEIVSIVLYKMGL